MASIHEETQAAVEAARKDLTELDRGAVAVLLELARQIDFLAANNGLREDGKLDNVSIPTFLKYCEALGLTPAGRNKLAGDAKPAGPAGKLASLKEHAEKRTKSA